MEFDKRSLEKLLALDDAAFESVIREVAAEAGIKNLSVGRSDIAKLRAFLSVAGEGEINALLSKLGGRKNG